MTSPYTLIWQKLPVHERMDELFDELVKDCKFKELLEDAVDHTTIDADEYGQFVVIDQTLLREAVEQFLLDRLTDRLYNRAHELVEQRTETLIDDTEEHHRLLRESQYA